ncbi:MAG: transporter substrate-binding domain-containing protein, partial [Deltaproteobacteria bacterium]|nr:transporter substrate-binding domain-containing protein [Deltaproteobacteria bacterium]
MQLAKPVSCVAALFSSRNTPMKNKHLRRDLLITFIACCCIVAAGATTTPISAQQTSHPQAVKITMDNNYPPYVFHDSSGKLQGILIDQWRFLGQKKGIKGGICCMGWGGGLRRMEKGGVGVIDTIFLNEKRAEIYDFSKPYATIDVSIFFHKNISGIVDVDSIKGFAVAVKAGDAAVDFLRKKGVTQLLEFSSYEAIIKAAQEKKITVFVMDKPPALYFLYKAGLHDEFRFSEPLYTGQFHRAVTKGHPNTLNLVEEGFLRISADEYETIDKKWFGSHFTFPTYLMHLAYAAAVLAVLGLALGAWNYTLRKKVRERTDKLLKALDNLKVSEERYRELVESANSIILRMDGMGTVTFFNEYAQKFFGYHEREILGRNVVGTIVPELESTGRDLKFLIGDISVNPERYANNLNENIKRNGDRVWIAWTNKPVMNPAGQVIEILCVGIDVTERRKAEE